MSASAVTTNAFLSNGQTSPINFLNPFAYATVNSSAWRGINADTFLLFKNGMLPEVDIFTSGDSAGDVVCTLSGYHQ
jgi:hypothetical protein